jgi:hypothetical protein
MPIVMEFHLVLKKVVDGWLGVGTFKWELISRIDYNNQQDW